MLSRQLDEAIIILRNNESIMQGSLNSKLADLLLVCAAHGDIIQAVAEGVAKEIISLHKQELGKVELRDV